MARRIVKPPVQPAIPREPFAAARSAALGIPRPVNNAVPTLTGGGTVGSTLTYFAGLWSDADQITPELQRDGVPVAGWNGATYEIDQFDVGATFRVVERATNAGGTTIANTAPVFVAATAASGLPIKYDSNFASFLLNTGAPFLNLARVAPDFLISGGTAEDEAAFFEGMDANGHPTVLPGGIVNIRTLLNPQALGGALAGDYVIKMAGVGTPADYDLRPNANVTDFTYDPLDPLRATYTSATGVSEPRIYNIPDASDPLRVLYICRAEDEAQVIADLAAGRESFRPEYLAEVARASDYRFMNYMLTNRNDFREWSEWPTPQARTFGAVWSIEALCQLVNEASALGGSPVHPWFHVPVFASDDLIRQMARTVDANLHSSLVPRIAWVNETWNTQFRAAGRISRMSILDLAVPEPGTISLVSGSDIVIGTGTSFLSIDDDGGVKLGDNIDLCYEIKSVESDTQLTLKPHSGSNYTGPDIVDLPFETGPVAREDWYVKGAVRVMKLWAEEFGARPFKKLLETHQGNPSTGAKVLAPVIWEAFEATQPVNGYEDPTTFFDALAISNYFANKFLDNKRQELLDALALDGDAPPYTNALAVIRDAFRDPEANHGIPAMGRLSRAYSRMVTPLGLELWTYEGGDHAALALAANDPDNQRIAAVLEYMHFVSQVGAELQDLAFDHVRVWFDGPYSQYTLFNVVGTGGMFASARHLNDLGNPRHQGLLAKAQATGKYYGQDVLPQVVFPFEAGELTFTTADSIIIPVRERISANTKTLTSLNLPAGLAIGKDEFEHWQITGTANAAFDGVVTLVLGSDAGTTDMDLPLTITEFQNIDPADPALGATNIWDFTAYTGPAGDLAAFPNALPGRPGLTQTIANRIPSIGTELVNGFPFLICVNDSLDVNPAEVGAFWNGIGDVFSIHGRARVDSDNDFVFAFTGGGQAIANLTFQTSSLRATCNTSDGQATCTVPFDRTTGDFNYSLVYDGAELRLYINELPVEIEALTGTLNLANPDAAIGSIASGANRLTGRKYFISTHAQAHDAATARDFRRLFNSKLGAA